MLGVSFDQRREVQSVLCGVLKSLGPTFPALPSLGQFPEQPHQLLVLGP